MDQHRRVEDDCPSVMRVAEQDELNLLVARAARDGGRVAHALFDRFKAILDEYREQSELLDPLLEGLVAPLTEVLRAAAMASAVGDNLCGMRGVSRLLWTLASTRGRKTVMRFFPNQAADMEPVLTLLERSEVSCTGTADAAGDDGGWEARCVLLLWLAILVLIPFDLATIDSRDSDSAPPLVQRIAGLCRGHLQSPGPEREVSALVLGRLLTRQDAGSVLAEFLAWAPAAAGGDSPDAAFLLPGVAAALAEVFKAGQPGQVAPLAAKLTGTVLQLGELPAAASSSLARKLLTKLATHMALALLPPRPAAWRYRHRNASLHTTLQRPGPSASPPVAAAATGSETAPPPATDGVETPPVACGEAGDRDPAAAAAADEAAQQDAEAAVDISREVEDIIGWLLQALQDPDTVVRWSAAKGLGRVTGRLPAAAGSEVLDNVLQELADASPLDEATRHGCCLALAELARRGLLLPARLPEVVPHVAAALHYDVRRGAHSLGTPVRDAAAYVCWAISRAYTPEEVAPYIAQLAPALLTAAVLDREVACRRAAAAAFQEAVGRLGAFPDGIALLTAADYFTLSSRSQAYTVVAPQIAGFAAYRRPVAEALLRVKLRHWDDQLRSLAARALALLVPLEPEFFVEVALPELRAAAVSTVLEVRQGALQGLAELLPALAKSAAPLPAPEAAALEDLVSRIEAARLLRGRGGELMRATVCRYIECLSLARLPLDDPHVAALLAVVDEQLRHPNDAVHIAAAAALHAFTRAYPLPAAPQPRGGQHTGASAAAAEPGQQFVLRCLEQLAQCGGGPLGRGPCAALGALPAALLAPAAGGVLRGLAGAACVKEGTSPEVAVQRVEARVAAVRALAAVVQELAGTGGGGGGGTSLTQGSNCAIVSGALLGAMDDYTTDNRGDVGSWTREAAMAGLVQALPLLVAASPPDAAAAIVSSAASALVKQAVERIARVRQAAGGHLQSLLDVRPPLPGLPQRTALAGVLSRLGPDGCASLQALPQLAALLPEPRLRPALLEGLATGLGGLDARLAAAAASALTAQLGHCPRTGGDGAAAAEAAAAADQHGSGSGVVELLRGVLDDLQLLWQRHAKSARMALPLLRLADLLLTQCGAPRLWPRHPLAAGPKTDPVDCQRLQALMEAVKSEGRGCGDVGRMCLVPEALAHLAACGPPVRDGALTGVLTLLVSRMSRVRWHAAEQLYVQLLVESESPDAAPQEALQVLATCSWDGDVAAAKAARQRLYPLLGLQPPAVAAGKKCAAGRPAAAAAAKGGEGASYQMLIDTAARHR